MGDLARQYSPSGIEYRWRLQPEMYRETFARNANQISIPLVCRWDDAGDLKADIMESSAYNPAQRHLTRSLPMKFPDTDALFLTSMVSQKPLMNPKPDTPEGKSRFDPTTGLWYFERIEYLCTFTNLPYEVKSDADVKSNNCPELSRYVVITPSPIASNRQTSSKSLNVETGAAPPAKQFEPINEVAAIPEIVTRFQIKQFMWPKAAIPWASIYSRMGKVNEGDFILQGVTNPAETLLYEGLGSSPEEYTGPDGKKYVDITHVLTRHPENWNKTKFNGAYRYLRVGTADPAVRRYDKTTFNEIFTPKQGA
jgi:hypothetical protein